MILNYIQFLLSFFDQGVVKSSIVSLNCETLNVPLMYVVCMLLQATIIRNYFVKTQTSVASLCPPDLSIIFSNGMYLEVSPL